MAFTPFDRSYYPRSGGAGFGGNSWVSLMGGAAQGLLAAQKNRAELIKQAQEEALRRAAEQRAIDSSQRERERLEMARKEQAEASKARMKAEEERVKAERKAREEEAAIRARSQRWLEQARSNPEMSGYYTDAELESLAPRVAAGEIMPPRPPKPPKDEVVGDRFVRTPSTQLKITAAERLNEWDERHLGAVGGPNMSMEGPTTLPPAQGNVIFHEGKPVTDPAMAYQLKLIPELRAKITQTQRDLEVLPKSSPAYLQALRDMETYQALLDEAIRRMGGGSGGDFANQGFDYSSVDTSPDR